MLKAGAMMMWVTAVLISVPVVRVGAAGRRQLTKPSSAVRLVSVCWHPPVVNRRNGISWYAGPGVLKSNHAKEVARWPQVVGADGATGEVYSGLI